jgi:hypothetical protein
MSIKKAKARPATNVAADGCQWLGSMEVFPNPAIFNEDTRLDNVQGIGIFKQFDSTYMAASHKEWAYEKYPPAQAIVDLNRPTLHSITETISATNVEVHVRQCVPDCTLRYDVMQELGPARNQERGESIRSGLFWERSPFEQLPKCTAVSVGENGLESLLV